MYYKSIVLLVFVLLLLGLALVFIFPDPNMLAFGAIFLPFLILLQVWAILRANTQSQKTDAHWYDNM